MKENFETLENLDGLFLLENNEFILEKEDGLKILLEKGFDYKNHLQFQEIYYNLFEKEYFNQKGH